jgi:hypothetical protein
VYRADSSNWQHPQAIVPPDSYLDHESGGMRSPMPSLGNGTGARGAWLTIPKDLAPLTLAFAIHVAPPQGAGAGGKGRYIRPMASPHFAELIGMETGQAEPLGGSLRRRAAGHHCAVGSQQRKTVDGVSWGGGRRITQHRRFGGHRCRAALAGHSCVLGRGAAERLPASGLLLSAASLLQPAAKLAPSQARAAWQLFA